MPPNGEYAISHKKFSAYVVKEWSKNSGQLQNSGPFSADQSSPLYWSFTVLLNVGVLAHNLAWRTT